MAQSDLDFDAILRGPAQSTVPPDARVARELDDGYVSSWLAGVLCISAFFTALSTAFWLSLSVRDDEASLTIGFGTYLACVAGVLWILGATLTFFITPRDKWTVLITALTTGTLGAAAVIWALTVMASAPAYIP